MASKRPVIRRKHREPSSYFDSDPEEEVFKVRRKHREPSSYFKGDPEDDVLDKRNISKEVERLENMKDQGRRKKERSVCRFYKTEQKMIDSECKVEEFHNQLDSFADKHSKNDKLEDCAHSIPKSRKSKGALDEGECDVELEMENESNEFIYEDWVEEQLKTIREIAQS